ncbi:MAG TPA: beta-ketoacyl-[acyl-carrier-protein] synthase family protein [Gemmatimonadota bacterium]|nr:beta-ketoacyl-[acyl-carrier-protein] synthase family protein [Gemmatimonadota bacterium]
MTRLVAITGVGAVTAAGPDAAHLAEALRRERSTVQPSADFDGLPVGSAPDPPRATDARRLDRSAAFFLTAAEEAWRSAGLADPPAPDRCAVFEGSSLGPMAELLCVHRERLASSRSPAPRPSDLVRFMPGAGGVALALRHGIEGPVSHHSAGSVSAAWAIIQAVREIESGAIDVAVAGGGEAPLQEDLIASFGAAGILSPARNGDPPCRPFDRRRSGTVLGEGAGALVLESLESARSRGVRPLATMAGIGTAGEAHSVVRPRASGRGVRRAAEAALRGIDPGEIGWIKAHGTGTVEGDAAECRGLAALFERRLPRIPLTSLKPLFGHCLGASAAVEAAAAVLALASGLVPATLGSSEPDPELPPFALATRTSRSDAPVALLLSEGFGGRCAALVLRRA